MVGTSFAHYRIVAKLGEGGMGEVYRATDDRLQRDVAIKVLPESVSSDADRLARFAREARVLASLNHPNIAQVYGLEEHDRRSMIVLELIEGETLAERIARGPLPIDEARRIALQIVEALAAAHRRGVIHRDLKPANVKVSADGTVKVLDFGLAKSLDDEASPDDPQRSPTLTARSTHAGVLLGTAAYMSPEQAKGAPVDERTDVWALGVVLFEMLTGRELFAAPSVPETLAQVLTREPDFGALPAAVPPSVRRALRLCLVRDPRKRLHAIADARVLLEDGSEDTVSRAPAAARTGGRLSAVLWPAVLVGAGVAAALLSYRAGRSVQAPLLLTYPIISASSEDTRTFDVTRDGSRILAISVPETDRPRRIEIVTDWAAGLAAR